MKITAIGDIHGQNDWKKIVNKNDSDKIIFIGDYFDSFFIKGEDQINNFKDIIAYKKKYPEKVILLIGNHDFHYLDVGERYSGFQKDMQYYIASELSQAINEGLMQMCYVTGNLLFAHAGLTKTWCQNNNIDLTNLQKSVNDTFIYRPNAFKFKLGKRQSNTGDDICQGPIWVRSRSLYIDKIPGYTQIVGHTVQDKISGLNGSLKLYDDLNETMFETSGVVFIDTLQTSKEYLEIIDGKMTAKHFDAH